MDHWTWLLLAVLLLAIPLLYAPTFHFPFTDWDDQHYVYENAGLDVLDADQVRLECTRFVLGNYHPVTMLSYAAEVRLAGKDPHLMHRTNVLLHALNALLVFLFLRRLTGDPRPAVLAALLWALHPLRVESVAWISARKDLLMLFFSLLSLLAYMEWLAVRRSPWLAASIVAFLLACLSKAMAVALVPTLFLIDWSWSRKWVLRTALRGKAPFVVIALAVGVVAVMAQEEATALSDPGEHLAQRVVAALANLAFYLGQQFVPVGLSAHYGQPELTDGWIPWYYFVLAMVPIVLALLWRRLGPPAAVTFGALFFIAHLALVLQLLPFGHAIRADRYSYVAGIGWALGWVVLLRGIPLLRERPMLLVVLVLVQAGALGVLARERTRVWSNPIAVWDDILHAQPENGGMHMSRGLSLKKLGRTDEAMAALDLAVRFKPADQNIPYYHRGMLHLELGHYPEAAADFRAIVSAGERPPGVVPNLVYAEMKSGGCDSVLAHVAEHLDRVAGTIDLLNARAWCLLESGRVADARSDVDRSMAMDSGYAAIRFLAGRLALVEGDTPAACMHLQRSTAWALNDGQWRQLRDTLLRRHCGERAH